MKVNKRLLSKFDKEFVISNKELFDKLVEVLKEDMEGLHRDMRNKVIVGSSGWDNLIACQLGEQRRLQSLIELFSINEE